MNNKITINPFSGKSSKTGKEYHCFKLEIGDWSTLIFPRSKFERDYIESVLEAQ